MTRQHYVIYFASADQDFLEIDEYRKGDLVFVDPRSLMEVMKIKVVTSSGGILQKLLGSGGDRKISTGVDPNGRKRWKLELKRDSLGFLRT